MTYILGQNKMKNLYPPPPKINDESARTLKPTMFSSLKVAAVLVAQWIELSNITLIFHWFFFFFPFFCFRQATSFPYFPRAHCTLNVNS